VRTGDLDVAGLAEDAIVFVYDNTDAEGKREVEVEIGLVFVAKAGRTSWYGEL